MEEGVSVLGEFIIANNQGVFALDFAKEDGANFVGVDAGNDLPHDFFVLALAQH